MSSTSGSTSPEAANKRRKRKRNDKSNNSDASDVDPDSDKELENPNDEEEPVLSHAEKRRRKRERKRAEKLKDGDTHPKKKRKLKNATSETVDAPTTTKRENSVWVGNLSYKTQHENLREFFKGAGEITRINMPTKVGGGPGTQPENRGFAYVDFATPEAKIAAVALSEQPLFGRKLLIKDGDDFEGRPAATTLEGLVLDPSIAHKTRSKTAQRILSAQKQPAGPTLFFGNLPFQITEDEIRQLLNVHRPPDNEKGTDDEKKHWIRKIRMGTFEDSGLCKGFAFVDFTSIDNATAALINPKNHSLNGRDLVVQYASPDAVRRGGSRIGTVVPHKRRPLSAGYKKTRGRKEKDKGEAQDGGTAKKPTSASRGLDGFKTKKEVRKKKSFCAEGVADRGKEERPMSRPTPGSALAKAKRETAAIVPSQGKKIVF